VAEVTLADKFQALTRAGQAATRNRVRQAWVLNSTYSQEKGIKPIIMSVNPNSVKFTQAKRTSTARMTVGGTTFFHWADRKGRNLNPLILTISGETGPMSGLGKTFNLQKLTSLIQSNGKVDERALKHAQNFARFYTLTTQPMIDPDTFKPNVFTIQYKSLVFPDVTFRGFWNSVLEFTDDAANPFSKKYQASFTVTGVSPDITVLENLIGLIDTDLATRQSGTLTAGEPPANPGVA
jgi:hypothetical protein